MPDCRKGRVSPSIDFEQLKAEKLKKQCFFSFFRFELLKIGKGMGFPGEPGRTGGDQSGPLKRPHPPPTHRGDMAPTDAKGGFEPH